MTSAVNAGRHPPHLIATTSKKGTAKLTLPRHALLRNHKAKPSITSKEKDRRVLSIFQTLEKPHKAFFNSRVGNFGCDATIISQPTEFRISPNLHFRTNLMWIVKHTYGNNANTFRKVQCGVSTSVAIRTILCVNIPTAPALIDILAKRTGPLNFVYRIKGPHAHYTRKSSTTRTVALKYHHRV